MTISIEDYINWTKNAIKAGIITEKQIGIILDLKAVVTLFPTMDYDLLEHFLEECSLQFPHHKVAVVVEELSETLLPVFELETRNSGSVELQPIKLFSTLNAAINWVRLH